MLFLCLCAMHCSGTPGSGIGGMSNTGMETKHMERIRLMLASFTTDKRAVTALEYCMIAALIAVLAISGFTGIGKNLSTTLSSVNTTM